MEFRLRNLLLALLLLSLGSIALYLGWPAISFNQFSLFPVGDRLPTPTRPTGPASPAYARFADESRVWDWDVQCAEALARFLQSGASGSLTISLVDEGQGLPLGVAYPDVQTPQALVFAGCASTEHDGDSLACQVTVQQGEPGDALDVAVTVATAYAVQDVYRDLSQAGWEARGSWSWQEFQPLIVPQDSEPASPTPEEPQWRSACLHVSRP